jgi:hypothetical protein
MFHRRSGCLSPSRKAVPQGALNLIYAVRALDTFLYAICQDANPLLQRTGIRADLSQSLVKAGGRLQTKMAPENRDHWFNPSRGRAARPIGPARRTPIISGSETEMGEVAIADGDTAAGGQQAVDGSHQTAEQGAGGQEADGCGLGHVCPLFFGRGTIPLGDLRAIYVYQMPDTTDLFA